jgi:hypothetical protein
LASCLWPGVDLLQLCFYRCLLVYTASCHASLPCFLSAVL